MMLKLYSLYDSFADEYMIPNSCRSDVAAVKAVTDAMDRSNDLSVFADLTLFCVGTYDTRTGEIKSEHYSIPFDYKPKEAK